MLSTVGEAAADQFFQGYLLNATMPGLHAQAIGAALISIERQFPIFQPAGLNVKICRKQESDSIADRYWGESSPFPQLNTSNLQYLTVQQAMSDFTNFASNATLPFDSGNASNAASVVSRIYGSLQLFRLLKRNF